MYSLLNFPATYFFLTFLNQVIFYVFTKRFNKLPQKMEISMTLGHLGKTDVSNDQRSPIPQGRAKIYGQFFMQNCVNKFLFLRIRITQSHSLLCIATNITYCYLVRKKLPLTPQFSLEIQGTGREIRAQVRPTGSVFELQKLWAEPQVNPMSR